MEPKQISSEHIENKIVTLTSENLSYEDLFETKLQPSLINLINFKTTRRRIYGFHITTASRIRTD